MIQVYKHNRLNFSINKSWILLPLPCLAPYSGDCFIWINIRLENNLAQKKPKQIQELKAFILWLIKKRIIKKTLQKRSHLTQLGTIQTLEKLVFTVQEQSISEMLKTKWLTSPKFYFKPLLSHHLKPVWSIQPDYINSSGSWIEQI